LSTCSSQWRRVLLNG